MIMRMRHGDSYRPIRIRLRLIQQIMAKACRSANRASRLAIRNSDQVSLIYSQTHL